MRHGTVSLSLSTLAAPDTGMPDITMTRACAPKRAVKRAASSLAQGTLDVLTPHSGQSARGTSQWIIVLYCQMSRWRHSPGLAS